MKRLRNWPWGTILYFSWGALVIACMLWSDLHLPNCLHLYGAAYGGGTACAKLQGADQVFCGVDQSDKFVACEDANTAHIFGAQAIGIAVIITVPIVVLLASAAFWWARQKLRNT